LISNKSYGFDPKTYYKDLRVFFDQCESNIGVKILIAAHPKANYHGKENHFGGRKIYYGHNSAELIRQAQFLIMHYSTAINLALLFRKPIIFITSNQLNSLSIGKKIESISNKLSISLININEIKNKQEIPQINNRLYDAYINDFIKINGTKDLLFWQQVADYVKKNT